MSLICSRLCVFVSYMVPAMCVCVLYVPVYVCLCLLYVPDYVCLCLLYVPVYVCLGLICSRLCEFVSLTGPILIKFAEQVGTVKKGVAFAIWPLSSNIRA